MNITECPSASSLSNPSPKLICKLANTGEFSPSMTLTISLKGKKRAIESSTSSPLSSISSESEPPHPTKRAKRAETRQCPVCDEYIPLRLLSRHAELESERVEDVIKKVGSSDITYDEIDDGSRVRRSALKARKSLTTRNAYDSLEQSGKTIQAVKRRRKQRHTKLKEMAREEEEGSSKDSSSRWFTGEAIVCPVCLTTIRGDEHVVDAHVDSCLANESLRMEETRTRELRHQRALDEEVWEDGGEEQSHPGHIGSVRGTGFHIRDRDQQDIEEEIDIDGDDQAIFGEAQFTEGDIIPVDEDAGNVDEDVDVDIESDEIQQQQLRLRELVAADKPVRKRLLGSATETRQSNVEGSGSVREADKTDMVIISAHRHGDKASLVLALEAKMREMSCRAPAILCRICLEPYSEPTASTGCWHTCCRLCWLKCLGTTKLCPICKRITGATDLRRIYL